MKSSAVLASVASVLSVVSAAPRQYNQYEAVAENVPALYGRQVPVVACSHSTGGVHVIAVPGEGFATPPYGLLSTLATSILNAIPGSTNVSVPYNHSDTNGVSQTQLATNNLKAYIFQYHYYCPNTKIVLIGYSSGAISVMNGLCGSEAPYNPTVPTLNHTTYGSTVVAAVTYGDETRTAGYSWDYGTCKGNGTHPRPNPKGCNPWKNIIHGYCDANDPLCCPSTGTNISYHYTYPQLYDQKATAYVVKKVQAAGGP